MDLLKPGDILANALERAILLRLGLNDQEVSELRVLSRKYTGVGLYTEFKLNIPRSSRKTSAVLEGQIKMPSVPNGLGAMLMTNGAAPECLEVFTHGDDLWNGRFEEFSIEDNPE
ncbi:MAG: hypothetical protein AAF542_25900 [Pseudomonadota bacterium]